MSNLAQYMREALENGQSVYLPEIGTFRKERVPAFFDALKECFVPPFRNLILSEEQLAEFSIFKLIATKNDSLKRRQFIEAEINDLKAELRNGDEVILEGLGRLKQNEQHIEFNAAGLAWNDYPDYEEVEEMQLLRNPATQEISEQESLVEEDVLVADILVSTDAPAKASTSRSWVWLIVAILAAGALFAWMWYSSPEKNQGEKATLSTLDNAPGRSKPAGESAGMPSPADTQKTESTVAPDDSVAVAPVSQEANLVRAPSGRFEIIIAAFHTMEEATEFVERTNTRGHNVYIIKNNRPNNLNKVSYASFDTEREVNEAIAKVRKEINPDAWIYKNKVNQ